MLKVVTKTDHLIQPGVYAIYYNMVLLCNYAMPSAYSHAMRLHISSHARVQSNKQLSPTASGRDYYIYNTYGDS